ncbi:MAG TPA: hypothetical protein VEL76_04850 [Gemmataceae bacterium]|nr:hypothetical protein [Gemmataceae bacterium]
MAAVPCELTGILLAGVRPGEKDREPAPSETEDVDRRGERLAARRERHGGDRSARSFKPAQRPTVRDSPEADGLVVAAGGERLAVARQGQGQDAAGASTATP